MKDCEKSLHEGTSFANETEKALASYLESALEGELFLNKIYYKCNLSPFRYPTTVINCIDSRVCIPENHECVA